MLDFANFEDILPFSIPILALMIPIVVVLAKHQQQMARIIHGGQSRGELDAMRAELEQLRSMVHYQARSIEEMKGQQAPAHVEPPSPTLQNRLGG